MNNILKHITVFSLFFVIGNYCKAQSNFKINANISGGKARITSVYLEDEGITIFMDNLGRLHDVYLYDTDQYYDAVYDNQTSALGNEVEYYPADYIWTELRNKIKRIGKTYITYYDRFSFDELQGKIKSIGNLYLTYYDRFGWDELKGKVRSIDTINFTYYDRFGANEDIGKMKSIGNTTFSYAGRMVNVAGDRDGVVNIRRAGIR
ncbi:hypothetical protein IM792_08360 [Mucilaginibacter sp. JRF]|uniref:hypothetical protein n=1 Tax=Mucilaginibacter sp. JRF TaxID=2780088 RepID=UPI00187E3D75|nr:hypothetical protein [Mucilaginibacter sp. JRF]MBE9584456.1 hypothetical protein [Mucilaginibacter sp. JRF]